MRRFAAGYTPPPSPAPRAAVDRPLRIGYFSTDFGDRPLAHAIAGQVPRLPFMERMAKLQEISAEIKEQGRFTKKDFLMLGIAGLAAVQFARNVNDVETAFEASLSKMAELPGKVSESDMAEFTARLNEFASIHRRALGGAPFAQDGFSRGQ